MISGSKADKGSITRFDGFRAGDDTLGKASPNPVVNCGKDLLELYTNDDMLNYHELVLKPGIGKVLVEEGENTGVFSLRTPTDALIKKSKRQHHKIVKVFANNGDAYQYLTSQSCSPVLAVESDEARGTPSFCLIKSPLDPR